MRTTKNLLTLAFAMFTTFAFAQFISGTAHDLSGAGWNSGTDEICITCHTPHNATEFGSGPLWDHALSAEDAYTLYSSNTIDATMGQPSGESKLCLGCHDGSVGLEAFGGVATATNLVSGAAQIGGGVNGLSDHHPVSFTYTDALASTDGGLHAPTTGTTTLGGTIDDDLLFGTLVQCSSCHDPHNNENGKFLKIGNGASVLCLTCHNK